MSGRVRVEIESGIADVRLTRADKLNALDAEMFSAITDAGTTLAADRSLRAVVLSGEGRSFCAGVDVANFAKPGGLDPFARNDAGPANRVQRAAWVWNEVPVPVIAAIHGACFGGGLQIALGADIRFARPDAKLSVMESKWGLIPDMSLSQTLLQLVRADVAKELTFTGRILSGDEAAELGLVTQLSEDPLAAAFELAHEIARRSPDAVRAAKQLLDKAPQLSVEQGLRLEEGLQRALLGKANQREAVKANLEKRDPEFSDP
ncbi:MAG: crotonase/enoyl-CoA hydratase family protein [Deltaproteobacteria bacterium]|nr:crotonase/enoyl-CoA hydratase family protein [Deltaproteobacteria bacterium]MBW2360052.1 crotonase/enoyl-CoA hydratase family protein [Deltaproteobacteria bacterium]